MSKLTRLKEIEKRVSAATPGPWAYEATGTQSNEWCLGVVMDDDEHQLSGRIDEGQGEVVEQVCSNESAAHFNDAEFIAHAREDIPWLLAQLKEAVGVIEELVDIVDDPEARKEIDSFTAQPARAFLSRMEGE